MVEIDKFRADAHRSVKHERRNATGNYNGQKACQNIADLFVKYNSGLEGLSKSISEYWMETYIFTSEDISQEPTEDNIEWLMSALAFLNGSSQDCECFTTTDWQNLANLVNYEAEDIPIELLTSYMGILLEKQVL